MKIINVFNDKKIDNKKTLSILMIIMVVSGIFGFIYEELFYKIDLGYFVKRGSSFGPWIPIYAFGGLLITIITYRFRKKPWLVMFISAIITGLLEFITGYILFHLFNIRLWDYNKEIWNFGNIGGYVCLRSILFFAFSSLFLVYVIIPLIIKISKKTNSKLWYVITYSLFCLFILDILLYQIIM